MIDFSFLISRLQKTIKVPRDFTLPLMHETSGNYDKSELNERVYHNVKCYFSIGSVIEIYQYTQKQFLVESLTWSEEQYSKGNIPILAYSLRAFIEASANYHAGITQIETAFSIHNSLEKNDDLWTKSLKESLYDLVIELVLPTTLKVPDDDIKANSGSPADQEQKMTSMQNIRRQPFEFKDSHSLANTKSSVLRPNNVLTNLKKLEKTVDGIHPAYDLLSEIMHPNSYPLVSQMNQFHDIEDASRPLVIWQFKNPIRPTLETYDLDNIATVIHDCANVILRKEEVLPKLSKKIKGEIKQYVRPVIKAAGLGENARYERKPCLCGSKKRLKNCCGKTR
ncbi:hypothetical protein OAK82_03040 [Candidatus Thioglobus sp.]|nr:hypothetical protein [Candidatus Thioglobus sp.]